MRYQVVELTATQYPVDAVCRAVRVSRSGFYAWQQRMVLGEPAAAVELRAKVETVFWRHSRRYGSRRVVAQLLAEGTSVGRRRVRRLMRERNLRAIQPKRFVPRTTDSRHGRRASPNLLHGALMPQEPNRVLVGDITYLPLLGGSWAYLATWQDLYSRMIVGWAVAETMTEELIITGLKKAIKQRSLANGCIVHSDRGGQYVGGEFRHLLSSHDLRQSMSRKGETYDNAFAESLFSRYKAEVLEGGVFRDAVEARLETFSYIEGYYNRVRRHSALGYQSPAEYERAFYEKAKTSTINDNNQACRKDT
jgi:transposase InsO family protein